MAAECCGRKTLELRKRVESGPSEARTELSFDYLDKKHATPLDPDHFWSKCRICNISPKIHSLPTGHGHRGLGNASKAKYLRPKSTPLRYGPTDHFFGDIHIKPKQNITPEGFAIIGEISRKVANFCGNRRNFSQ